MTTLDVARPRDQAVGGPAGTATLLALAGLVPAVALARAVLRARP
jgi:hypothetical protein